jgi:hypothetical protein
MFFFTLRIRSGVRPPWLRLALPNSAQFRGIFVAIIDHNLILGISSPLTRCI